MAAVYMAPRLERVEHVHDGEEEEEDDEGEELDARAEVRAEDGGGGRMEDVAVHEFPAGLLLLLVLPAAARVAGEVVLERAYQDVREEGC